METSSFGSELVALRQCCEYLKGLRYKLRMMGIPVNNPCFVYGYDQSVLWNTSKPDSMLTKKTASVPYHFVLEGVSANEWRTAHINTKLNTGDIITKNLPAGENMYWKVHMVLFDIHPKLKMRMRQDKCFILGHHYNFYLEGSIKHIQMDIIYRYINILFKYHKRMCLI